MTNTIPESAEDHLEPDRPEIRGEEWLALLFVCVATFLAIVAFIINNKTLAASAQLGEAVGGIGTFIFSLLGSAAAFWWFLRRDPLRPRITIEQEVFLLPQLDGQHAVQVAAHLKNVGEIIVKIDKCMVWGYPLDPLPDNVQDQLRKCKVLEDHAVTWGGEHCCGGELSIKEVRVRPGETQAITVNLLIPSHFKLVKIKTSIPHKRLNLSQKEYRVWSRFTILKLESNGGA